MLHNQMSRKGGEVVEVLVVQKFVVEGKEEMREVRIVVVVAAVDPMVLLASVHSDRNAQGSLVVVVMVTGCQVEDQV